MNLNQIEYRIKNTKELIENNHLSLPTGFEFIMADYVLTYVQKFEKIEVPTMPNISTYEKEKVKVYKELNRHFNEEEPNLEIDFIQNFYTPTNEISNKARALLNNILINTSMPSDMYSTTFKCHGTFPCSLNIPYQLNNLSYIWIGHEVLHLLKDTNPKEWENLLRHSDILPMLYELMQLKYKRKNARKSIVAKRMQLLFEMNQKIINAEKILGTSPNLEIYKLPEYQYFISFYYTILLYELYLTKYPKTILRELKKVLLHEKTTQELLEYFEIYERLEIFDFGNGCERLLKIFT